MKEELVDFIESKLCTGDSSTSHAHIEARLKDLKGKVYPQRELFYKIQRQLDNFVQNKTGSRWLTIAGLRGVGKSTLMAQLYQYLQVQSQSIIYFSVDEITENFDSNIYELLTSYEKLSRVKLEDFKPLFLLLDEVHYDPKWSATLKTFYDRYPNLFIICTGSSALELQTNKDEVRRISFEQLLPASFTQHLKMQGDDFDIELESINHQLWHSQSALELYQELKTIDFESKIKKISLNYEIPEQDFDNLDSKFKAIILRYLYFASMPFTLDLIQANRFKAYQALENSISRILSIDIDERGEFRIARASIKRLLYMIAISGDAISLESFASNLGINKATVADLLEALVNASVLTRYYPRSRKQSKLRKSNKYLFLSPAIRAAILQSFAGEPLVGQHHGALLEDYMNLYFRRVLAETNIQVCYWATKNSADFSVDSAVQEIPVEISFDFKDSSQVKQSLSMIKNPTYAVVFCNRELELADNVVFVPWQYLFLL